MMQRLEKGVKGIEAGLRIGAVVEPIPKDGRRAEGGSDCPEGPQFSKADAAMDDDDDGGKRQVSGINP